MALKEIRRVLRPDGELHIMDFCKPQTMWSKLAFAFFHFFPFLEFL
ncbi:MAG: class I SAM-dependent methyltransferase [Deltaproteobacteria bacterium]